MKQRLHSIQPPRRHAACRIVFLLLSLLLLTPWTGRAQGTPPDGTEANPFVVDGNNLEAGAAENHYEYVDNGSGSGSRFVYLNLSCQVPNPCYKLINLTFDDVRVEINCACTVLLEGDITLRSLVMLKGTLKALPGKSASLRLGNGKDSDYGLNCVGSTSIEGDIKIVAMSGSRGAVSLSTSPARFQQWRFPEGKPLTKPASFRLRSIGGETLYDNIEIPAGVKTFAFYIPDDKAYKLYTLRNLTDDTDMQALYKAGEKYTRFFQPGLDKLMDYTDLKPYGPLTGWTAGTLQFNNLRGGWYIYNETIGNEIPLGLFDGTLSGTFKEKEGWTIRTPRGIDETLTLADGFSMEAVEGSYCFDLSPSGAALSDPDKQKLTLRVAPAASGEPGTATLKASAGAFSVEKLTDGNNGYCEVAGECTLFLYGGVAPIDARSSYLDMMPKALSGIMDWHFEEAPAAGSTILIKGTAHKTLATFEADGITKAFACNVPYGDCSVWVENASGGLTRYETETDADGNSRSVFNYPDESRPYTRFADLVPVLDLNLSGLPGSTRPEAPLTLTCTAAGEWMWAYSDAAIDPTFTPQPFSGVVVQEGDETFACPLTVVIEATDKDNTSGTLIFRDVRVEPSTDDPALAIRKTGEHKAALKLVATSSYAATSVYNSSFRGNPEALTISGVDCDARCGSELPPGRFRLPRLVFFAAEQAVKLSEGATLMGVSSFAIPNTSETTVSIYERKEGSQISFSDDNSGKYNSYAMNHIEPLTVVTADATFRAEQQFLPEGGSTAYLREFPATDGYRSYVDPTPYGLRPLVSDMHITLSDTENKYVEHVDCVGESGLTFTLLGDRKLALKNPSEVRLEVGEKDGTSAPSTATVTLEDIQHDPFATILLRKGSGLRLWVDESLKGKMDRISGLRNVVMEEDASLSSELSVMTNSFMASIGTVGEAWRAVGYLTGEGMPTVVGTPVPGKDWSLPEGWKYPESLLVRTGFTGKSDQRWTALEGIAPPDGSVGTAFGLDPGKGYILATDKAVDPMEILLQAHSFTIPAADTEVDLPGPESLADGEFRFLPNPSLRPIRLRDIYTLTADGTRFELQEEEVEVQPFEAFLTANALTRQSLRSVGVGEPQTGDSLVTGIAAPPSLTAAALRVWGASGEMHLSTSRPADVRIFSLSGLPLRSFHLDGDRVEPLPAGIYLVVCEGLTYKIVL
ncbi:hypothetical protein [Parabacteroides sp.]